MGSAHSRWRATRAVAMASVVVAASNSVRPLETRTADGLYCASGTLWCPVVAGRRHVGAGQPA